MPWKQYIFPYCLDSQAIGVDDPAKRCGHLEHDLATNYPSMHGYSKDGVAIAAAVFEMSLRGSPEDGTETLVQALRRREVGGLRNYVALNAVLALGRLEYLF